MDLPRNDLERIVTDLRCTDCWDGPRCDDCQDTVSAAVAATLAAGVGPEHIHVRSRDRSTVLSGAAAVAAVAG